MRAELSAFALAMLISAFARADAIYLHGGHKLEGTARIEGDKVTVELESGTVSFSRQEVLRIEKGSAPLDEARAREHRIAADDVAGMLQLADYCRAHDLPGRERALLQRILSREPDHEEARRRLGYVRDGKQWVRESELARRRREAARTQRQAELARQRQEIELEAATLRRERAELELRETKAQLAEERASRAQPARPVGWYSPVVFAPGVGYWNNMQRGPAPHQAPTTNVAPSPINGVRSAESHYEEARRTIYGAYPPR